MKILLTGAGGQLGRSVCKRMPSEWDLIALNSSELDITSGPQVDTVFQKHKPVIVINAAAYTAVDLAQSNQKAAKAVNVEGLLIYVRLARRMMLCLFIFRPIMFLMARKTHHI
jgi:dTDP-4-dehydrorhamnose reductase